METGFVASHGQPETGFCCSRCMRAEGASKRWRGLQYVLYRFGRCDRQPGTVTGPLERLLAFGWIMNANEISILSGCVVMKRSPPIETWGWRDKRVEGLFESLSGWSCCIVTNKRLQGGELGWHGACASMLFAYGQGRAGQGWAGHDWSGLDSYSQTPQLGGPLATGWLRCRAVQPLGVDMSRRYHTHVTSPLLFSPSARVFHAASVELG